MSASQDSGNSGAGILVTIGMGLLTIATMLHIHDKETEQKEKDNQERKEELIADLEFQHPTFKPDGSTVLTFHNSSPTNPISVKLLTFIVTDEEVLKSISQVYKRPRPGESRKSPLHGCNPKGVLYWPNYHEFVFEREIGINIGGAGVCEIPLRVEDDGLAGIEMRGIAWISYNGGRQVPEESKTIVVSGKAERLSVPGPWPAELPGKSVLTRSH